MTQPSVVFVGPFPKPVHGQSLATERLRDVLAENGISIRSVDTGEGGPGVAGKVRRIMRLFASLIAVGKPSKWLYLSVNSGKGLFFTELQARIGKKMGKSLVIHHHVYRYIGEHDPMMEKLVETAGPDALHLANCDDMADLLRRRYPKVSNAIGYGNAGFVESSLADLPIRSDGPAKIVLGHMSNLTIEKGLDRAIETFRAAEDAGLPVELLLAGPCGDATSETIVQKAVADYPGKVRYLGPVYGERKTDFFKEINIFLFPTRYKNEAGPIVLLEAMAAGVPSVSTDQCCIPSMLQEGGGLSLKMHDPDAIERTIQFIRQYAASAHDFSIKARERYQTLLGEQSIRETQLVSLLSSD